ncbi:MAG: signal peptidase II [Candidatus Kapabacteria bacterium]|nr:signal peptidase II [Candidatus Kapabacteria bacterium]
MEIEKKNHKVAIYFWIASLFIILDQVTKLWIKGFVIFGFEHHGLRFSEQLPIIGATLQFIHVENAGGPFGIQFGVAKIFLSLFSVFASIALAWYLIKIKEYSLWIKIGVALIFAGAVGNLIDRVFYGVFFNEGALFYGKVVDFIQVDIPDVELFGMKYESYPIFNIADSLVTIGVALLIIFNNKIPSFDLLLKKQKPEIVPFEPVPAQKDEIKENTISPTGTVN